MGKIHILIQLYVDMVINHIYYTPKYYIFPDFLKLSKKHLKNI